MNFEYIEYLGLDTNYLQWVFNLLYPVVITFLLPFSIFFLFCFCSFLVHIFYLRGYLFNITISNTQLLCRKVLSTIWTVHGKMWHGHEIKGLHKIPLHGPAMLIFYHGALPIDFYYVIATIYTRLNRSVFCIGDKLLFKVPGFHWLLKELNVLPGTVNHCVELLADNNLVAISPGGVREALFSSEYYELLWGQRKGFARVVKQASVPVIPIFTKNLRESFRSLRFCQGFLRRMYERLRLPIVPIYGGFPVKLTTYIGDPMNFDANETEDEIALKVKKAVEDLISNHQQIPGNILRSLMERIF